jgi:hypothetical protein
MTLPPCARCQHSPDWHRHDDSDNHAPTDPDCPFRCIGYDCEAPGPVPEGGRACDCPDYVTVNPFDEHTRLWADEIRDGHG